MKRLLILLCAAVAVAGCNKSKNVDPPAELVKFTPTLDIEREWSTGLGGGDKVLRLGLSPAVDGQRVYAAGHGGEVEAFAAATGRRAWSADTKVPLSAGPGVGDGIVVVASSEGDVVALDAASGARRWQVQVGGEVLGRPAVSPQLVVVRTVSGKIVGLRTADGTEAWSYEQQVPRLSLRGSASPVINGDAVLCGFDNGKVVALSLASGDLLWEAVVSPPHGRTELERLADIDSAVRVADKDVYAVGFQGRIAMLALESGQIWWGRELSSHRGLDVDGEQIYVSTADGRVMAMRRRDGGDVWSQDTMLRRGLTAPAIDGTAVVVADYEGYVHWLDGGTGKLAGRASTDGDRVSNPPVAAGGLVFVQTDSGSLYAFRSRPRKRG